jgi:hypothetical protein
LWFETEEKIVTLSLLIVVQDEREDGHFITFDGGSRRKRRLSLYHFRLWFKTKEKIVTLSLLMVVRDEREDGHFITFDGGSRRKRRLSLYHF